MVDKGSNVEKLQKEILAWQLGLRTWGEISLNWKGKIGDAVQEVLAMSGAGELIE